MPSRPRFFPPWALLAAAGAFFLAWLVLFLDAPTIAVTLDPRSFAPATGRAFVVEIKHLAKFPYRVDTDSEAAPRASNLRLFENGTALGPAHILHDKIRSDGAGRYSHWNDELYFSSSDGSDPRTNGRRYSVQAQAQLRTTVTLAFGGLFLAAVLAGLRRHGSRLFALATLPASGGITPLATAALLLGLPIGVMTWLVALWRSGQVGMNGFTLGGSFPLTDALMYYICGASGLQGESGIPLVFRLGDATVRVLDLCSNRTVYPNVIQTLLAVTNWHPPAVLLVQAASAGFAVACLGLWLIRAASPVGALLACSLLVSYAFDQVVGLFTTEAVAFPLGIAAIVVLLAGARTSHFGMKLAGMALMGLALVTRPGALFALPLLVLWMALSEAGSPRRATLAGLAAIGALALGPVIQLVTAKAGGADAQFSLSNFSLVLYRFSVAARDYTAAYTDHPELFSSTVPLNEAYKTLYRLAIDNILTRPEVILATIAREAKAHLWSFAAFNETSPVDSMLAVLFCAGLIMTIVRIKRAEFSLLLCLIAGELLSVPVVMGDGGQRVLAATIGVRAALIGLGIASVFALVHAAWRRYTGATPPASAPATRLRSPELVGSILLGSAALAAILLPYSGALRLARLDPMPAPVCRTPLVPFATRLERETIALRIVPAGDRRSGEMGVLEKDALDDGTSSLWYAEDFQRVAANTTLLVGMNRVSPNERSVSAVGPMVLEGAIPDRYATIVGCIDPGITRRVAGAIVPVLQLK